jgi:hypothetical protein
MIKIEKKEHNKMHREGSPTPTPITSAQENLIKKNNDIDKTCKEL